MAALFVAALRRLWLDCIDSQNDARALAARVEALEQKYSRAAQPRWRAGSQFLERAQHEVSLLNVGAPAVDVIAECEVKAEATVIVETVRNFVL